MHYQRLRKCGTLDGPPSPYDRVLANTEVRPAPYPHLTPCLVFLGSLNERGYGRVTAVVDGRPRTLRVHQIVAERHLGPKPAGRQVMHACDVRACVNHEHLSYGTPGQNTADMRAKGRARGRNSRARR